MKLKYKEISLNIFVKEETYSREKFPVVFIHGFTGNATDWLPIIDKLENRFFPIAVDIVGHGKSDSPEDLTYYTEPSLTDQIKFIIDTMNLDKVILCGYSMGGRLALSCSLKYSEKVLGLILESSTAGIENPELRNERANNDKILAAKILREGVEEFIDYWMNIPLFDNLKNNETFDISKIIKEKKKNNPIGLSNSLLGFSTGQMENHWEKLSNLKTKTLLITGELDNKFTEINKRITSLLPTSRHEIIKGCGHNTHLENHEDFFILVSSFLRTFIS